jgi:hypothetical protein
MDIRWSSGVDLFLYVASGFDEPKPYLRVFCGNYATRFLAKRDLICTLAAWGVQYTI